MYPFVIAVNVNVGTIPSKTFVFSGTVNETPESRLSNESAEINKPVNDVKYSPNVT